ncbi:hypothetical protein MUK42_19145 [Musa troglodytarum]|uniref:Uncharacterized protein n=1 Tax=Musa troglodytarum TaxID=320322 RepID=A0A9E7JKC6_9LILI|nr:hypothetical protein MUK42_19145 [Musa troglodytarum]
MADEEPVDPKQYLEDTCKPKCIRPLRAYQEALLPEEVALLLSRAVFVLVGVVWALHTLQK